MPDQQYDVVVIGSGPGGQKAAVQGAKAGKKVALVEREREPGGACLFQGTIPSKTLREAALMMMRLKQNTMFKVDSSENREVATLMERLESVLKAHTNFINDYLDDNNIDHHHGRAKLVESNKVEVTYPNGDTQLLNTNSVVIATGSRPRTPPNIPVDHENILDSDSILSMLYLPQSLTVIGGGVIGSEYASIFSMLGVKVTLIDKAPRPLFFMDPELTELFVKHFEKDGGVYMGEQIISNVSWDGVSKVITELESGEKVISEKMLVCQGRSANVEQLGLDAVPLEQGKYGHIAVNENYQSSIPNIYAVGDVIGPPALASCSMEQGRRAMCHALGKDPGHAFNLVPIGIYSVPELASVGLTEEEAREQYGEIFVGRARYEEISRAQIAGYTEGLLKLISDGKGDKILGVQVVGVGATDLIHMGEIALLNNNSVRIFLENILNFPTMGEAYRIAALNLINQVPASNS